MIITSKYPGNCLTCGRPYHVGAQIDWQRGTKGASHAACTEEGQRQAQAVAESRLTDVAEPEAFNVPAPEGLSYLPYQRAGIAYALSRTGTLIGDEMGLGKTIQAIGVINGDASIKTVLIVCPKSVRINWGRELKKWLTRAATIILIDGMSRTLATGGDLRITIINHDVIAKRVVDLARGWDLVIEDECHNFKNGTAKRTKAMKQIAKTAKRKIALSGTPLPNRPLELWPILQMIDPEHWDPAGPKKKGGPIVAAGEGAGFMRFAFRFCNAHQTRHGWDFSGASHLDELQDKLRATCMVRRLKRDVLTDLPAKRRQVIELPGGDEAVAEERAAFRGREEMFEQLQAEVELARAGSDEDYAAAVGRLNAHTQTAFTEISRIRAATALAKADQVIEHIREALETSEKVVIFAHHHALIERLKSELAEFQPVLIYGPTESNARQEAVDRFQKDPAVRVFIGGIHAAGTGITLTAASHVIFAELDWVPGNVTQAEDRCHRIGQKECVLVQHLVLEGSLDARMARILVAKQDIADQALDRERAVILEAPALFAAEDTGTQGKREELEATVAKMTPECAAMVHEALRMLAGMCDGAAKLDGSGFSRIDVRIGHSLAEAGRLTPKQAALGARLVRKYRRQLGALAERIMQEAS